MKAIERPSTIIPSRTATSYFRVATPRFLKWLYDRMFHLDEVFMTYDDGARAPINLDSRGADHGTWTGARSIFL